MQFYIVCASIHPGDVSVGIKCDANMVGDKEADVDFDIIPNANDTFTVKYMPPAAGRLTVKILFTDKVQPHTHTQLRSFQVLISGYICEDVSGEK